MDLRSKVLKDLSSCYCSIIPQLSKKNKGFAVVFRDKECEQINVFKVYKTYCGAKNFIERIDHPNVICSIIDFTRTDLDMFLYGTEWECLIKQ